ncbi:hypothetical protein, partial [Streptomyces parvulus]
MARAQVLGGDEFDNLVRAGDDAEELLVRGDVLDAVDQCVLGPAQGLVPAFGHDVGVVEPRPGR